jgi:hypothetical protein
LAEYAIMADGSEEDLDMTSGYGGIDLLQD